MTTDSRNLLPYGARGVDFGNFSWEVRPDGKAHFFAKGMGNFHWTLHPGTSTGVLDLHQTLVNQDGANLHNTLFMIKLEDFEKVLNELGPVVIPGLLRQFRPLRLGWLRRRGIRIMRHPASTAGELAAVTKRNRRKRIEFDMPAFEAALDILNSPDELPGMPDGVFSLVAIRRWGTTRIGTGLKATDGNGTAHLLWARDEELLDWRQQTEETINDIVAKYEIAPQDYIKYLRL
jgi:hypothetical protein